MRWMVQRSSCNQKKYSKNDIDNVVVKNIQLIHWVFYASTQDTQFTDPRAFTVDKGANFTALSLLPLLPVNYKTTEEEEVVMEAPQDVDPFNPFYDHEDHNPSPQNSLVIWISRFSLRCRHITF